VLWLLLFVLFLGILIGLLLFWFRHHRVPPIPPVLPPCPPPAIPDQFDAPTLASTIGSRLAGTTANGAVLTSPIGTQVVWVDAGDEILVHLDSVQARILDRMVLLSVDLECDQTGRTPLVVSFALGNATDPAGLVAVTDEYPRGEGALAARWGEAVQAALWATLLGIAKDHATERGLAPLGISAATGTLTLLAGSPIGAGA
jgi:hypothetical protein